MSNLRFQVSCMSFVSHPRIIPDRVEERRYQTAMVEGCLGCNTLVILPTGLGKTVVALRVAAEYLKTGKVLILAPTKPLVDQHSRFFSEMLAGTVVSVMTGAMKPESRAELVEASDVVISTPQCVANDLESSRYNLDDFSLVIYDEAHRGVGNYSYVTVAEYCWSGMRSIGMTASPGSDYERIKEVCGNLDLRRIDIKSDDDPDVSPYVFDTYVNRIEVNIPPDLVKVSAILRAMLDRYTDELISLGLMDRGWPASTKHMLMIGSKLRTRIAYGDKSPVIFKGLSLQAVCIKLLHAISMAETQGMTVLRIYLDKLVAGFEFQFSGTEIVHQQVGVLDRDVQQAGFSGGAVMGCCGFVQVAAVVQFVAEVRVFYPALFTDPLVQVGRIRIDGAGRVQVSVGLLRPADVIDERVQVGFQFLVRMRLE